VAVRLKISVQNLLVSEDSGESNCGRECGGRRGLTVTMVDKKNKRKAKSEEYEWGHEFFFEYIFEKEVVCSVFKVTFYRCHGILLTDFELYVSSLTINSYFSLHLTQISSFVLTTVSEMIKFSMSRIIMFPLLYT
jgi:hypothetical protein